MEKIDPRYKRMLQLPHPNCINIIFKNVRDGQGNLTSFVAQVNQQYDMIGPNHSNRFRNQKQQFFYKEN